MNKKLNFICVGVQKSGTSTLHDILKQHPNISLPINKETHFFSETEKYKKGIKHYFEFYFNSPNTDFIGEIDPEYSYYPECGNRIYNTFGRIKIIFILRNPVERAFSHYLMTKRRGLESLTFERAIEQEKERLISHYNHAHFSYIARGLYLSQLESYENLFGVKNVKVMFFDDLIEDAHKFITDIVSFIGTEAYNFNYDIKSNPSSEPKSKTIRDFIYQPNKFKKGVGRLIPSKKIKIKIINAIEKNNLKESTKQVLSLEIKQKIYKSFFQNEILNLEKKLSVDLTSWKYNYTSRD